MHKVEMEASKTNVTVPGADNQAPVKRTYLIERDPSPHYFSKDPFKRETESSKRLDEALNLLMSWPNWSLWPFKIACPVLFMTAAMPGAIINSALRHTFVFGRTGLVSSYLACAGLPAIVAGGTHFALISSDILEQNTKCSICVQMRAVSLQVASGIFYGGFISPVANLWLGSRTKDLYLPKLTKEPKAVFTLIEDELKNKTVKNRLIFAGIAQAVVAMGMTYLEQESYYSVLLPIIEGKSVISKETRYIDPSERGY